MAHIPKESSPDKKKTIVVSIHQIKSSKHIPFINTILWTHNNEKKIIEPDILISVKFVALFDVV